MMREYNEDIIIVFGDNCYEFIKPAIELAKEIGREDLIPQDLIDATPKHINFLIIPANVMSPYFLQRMTYYYSTAKDTRSLLEELIDCYSPGVNTVITVINEDIKGNRNISAELISPTITGESKFYKIKNPTGITITIPDYVGGPEGLALVSSDYHLRIDKAPFSETLQSVPKEPFTIEVVSLEEIPEENNNIITNDSKEETGESVSTEVDSTLSTDGQLANILTGINNLLVEIKENTQKKRWFGL